MTTKNILIGVIVLLVLIILFSYMKNRDKTCFTLPRNPDPTVFGPKYWAALHKMMSDIPCPVCRGFAEKFMVFYHDFINVKLGKNIHNVENFNYFTDLIGKVRANNNTWVA